MRPQSCAASSSISALWALASISRRSSFSAPVTASTRHLLAQVFAGTVGGGVDLGLGQRLLAVGFGDRVVLGLVDHLVGALVGLLDDLVGLGARVLQRLVDLVLRLGEVLLAALSAAARPSAIFC